METKRKADDLTRSMRRDGWPTLCIHGDKNQGERDWVLSGIFVFSPTITEYGEMGLALHEYPVYSQPHMRVHIIELSMPGEGRLVMA